MTQIKIIVGVFTCHFQRCCKNLWNQIATQVCESLVLMAVIGVNVMSIVGLEIC